MFYKHLWLLFQVDFELDNGHKMSVDFEKSVQKNKKTGWERPVRIGIKDEHNDSMFTS